VAAGDWEEECFEMLASWDFRQAQRILVLGAGAVALSAALARKFTNCLVIHVDTERSGPAPRWSDVLAEGVANLEFFTHDLASANFLPGTMQAIIVDESAVFHDPDAAARILSACLAEDFVADKGYRAHRSINIRDGSVSQLRTYSGDELNCGSGPHDLEPCWVGTDSQNKLVIRHAGRPLEEAVEIASGTGPRGVMSPTGDAVYWFARNLAGASLSGMSFSSPALKCAGITSSSRCTTTPPTSGFSNCQSETGKARQGRNHLRTRA